MRIKWCYLYVFVFIFITCFSSKILAAPPSPVSCAPQLQKCFSKLMQLPEINALVSQIQSEGAIRIVTSNEALAKQFGAFWDPDKRRIAINVPFHRSEGEIIGSILFELHNAAVNKKLVGLHLQAVRKQISKQAYVDAVERLEYNNSLSASAIAESGIRKGIFPSSARLPIYDSFSEHLHVQRISGHSAQIAAHFDSL